MNKRVIIFVCVFCNACTVGTQGEKDYAPANIPVDVMAVPDAVPRYEERTRAGNSVKYEVLGKQYKVLTASKGYQETGMASWYGAKFHGRKTSNGEVYDMYAMTAAHKTLPIPSYVRVTNLKNQRSVVVRINDRGPFHENRIIDLSYTAAVKLGIQKMGTGFVEVTALDVEEPGKVAQKKFSQYNNKKYQNFFYSLGLLLVWLMPDNYSRHYPFLSHYSDQGFYLFRVKQGSYIRCSWDLLVQLISLMKPVKNYGK